MWYGPNCLRIENTYVCHCQNQNNLTNAHQTWHYVAKICTYVTFGFDHVLDAVLAVW
jgi:hypothetical protein